MKRKLRKEEFKRRLRGGRRFPKRFELKRYLNLTDEQIDNLIYKPLEKNIQD